MLHLCGFASQSLPIKYNQRKMFRRREWNRCAPIKTYDNSNSKPAWHKNNGMVQISFVFIGTAYFLNKPVHLQMRHEFIQTHQMTVYIYMLTRSNIPTGNVILTLAAVATTNRIPVCMRAVHWLAFVYVCACACVCETVCLFMYCVYTTHIVFITAIDAAWTRLWLERNEIKKKVVSNSRTS